MRLQIVYIDGCPNWQVAYARLREALQSLGAHIEVERVEIRTTTDADVWRFHGSPSLLMNGHDPLRPRAHRWGWLAGSTRRPPAWRGHRPSGSSSASSPRSSQSEGARRSSTCREPRQWAPSPKVDRVVGDPRSRDGIVGLVRIEYACEPAHDRTALDVWGTMQPVLITVLGVDVQTYGVSKAAAAFIAAWLLGRAFQRRGLPKESAHTLVLWATLWGFVAAKLYYLAEQLPSITMHDLGGMGFTWFGGLIGGVVAALVIIRRHHLPLALVAGLASVPLTIAYGVGRLGCLLSGDGTYGRPSDLPWAMSFPNGVVATDVPVHPTPLYEALAAGVIAVLLWRAGRRVAPAAVFGLYLVLSGMARFMVEFLRINDPVVLGLTQPQLWSLVSMMVGALLVARTWRVTIDRQTGTSNDGATERVGVGSVSAAD